MALAQTSLQIGDKVIIGSTGTKGTVIAIGGYASPGSVLIQVHGDYLGDQFMNIGTWVDEKLSHTIKDTSAPPPQATNNPLAAGGGGYPQQQYQQQQAYQQPAPQYQQQPQYQQPAPQYQQQPAPQYQQPAPQYQQPAPQYQQPQAGGQIGITIP